VSKSLVMEFIRINKTK